MADRFASRWDSLDSFGLETPFAGEALVESEAEWQFPKEAEYTEAENEELDWLALEGEDVAAENATWEGLAENGGATAGSIRSSASGGQLWTFRDRPSKASVTLFVPPAANGQSQVDVLFYAHGLLGNGGPPPRGGEALAESKVFQLAAKVVASGRPVVLVVPLLQTGINKSWHAHGYAQPGGLNRLVAAALAEVGAKTGGSAPNLGALFVAGHSRGYGILYPLIRALAKSSSPASLVPGLSGIWMLDASYPKWGGGFPDAEIAQLSTSLPGLKIRIAYLKGTPSDPLAAGFSAAGADLHPLIAGKKLQHGNVPARALPLFLGNGGAAQTAVQTGQEAMASSDRISGDFEDHMVGMDEALDWEADESNFAEGEEEYFTDFESGHGLEAANEAEMVADRFGSEAEWECEDGQSEWENQVVPQPGAASIEAAAIARRSVLPKSIGKCFRYVKKALQTAGAVDRYLEGRSAVQAGPILERQGFVNILEMPGAGIKSPYDAPVGAVIVYKAAPNATDKNRIHGHIEIRTSEGFASDYFSTRARTGARGNGLIRNSSNGRVVIGIYIKPDGVGGPDTEPEYEWEHGREDEEPEFEDEQNALSLLLGQGEDVAMGAFDWLQGTHAFLLGPILRRGSEGPGVAFLQRLMQRLGQTVSMDMKFGPGTQRAVQSLQRGLSLRPTGEADAPTKAAFVKALASQASTQPVPAPVSVPTGGARLLETKGKVRKLPISDRLRGLLIGAANDAGVDLVHVYSGGQVAKGAPGAIDGTNRTGSTRHDSGMAADLWLEKNGHILDFSKPADLPIFEAFVTGAARRGATGIGAADGYMGSDRMHVGFGSPTLVWGAGGKSANAPAWLKAAFAKGRPAPTKTTSK